MTYKILIKEEALRDIQKAYDYYEEQSRGLGEKFLTYLTEGLDDLEQHPHHYSFLFNQKVFRSKSLLPFPFLIAFEIEAETVIIFSVHNTHIDPSALLKKLGT